MAASMSLFRHTNSKGLKQESTPFEQEQDANSALSDLDRGEILSVAADIFAYTLSEYYLPKRYRSFTKSVKSKCRSLSSFFNCFENMLTHFKFKIIMWVCFQIYDGVNTSIGTGYKLLPRFVSCIWRNMSPKKKVKSSCPSQIFVGKAVINWWKRNAGHGQTHAI